MSYRRNELREGPLELIRKREARKTHLREGVGKVWVCSVERAALGPLLEGIYLEVPGEDPNRIFISFPSVSFQDLGFH